MRLRQKTEGSLLSTVTFCLSLAPDAGRMRSVAALVWPQRQLTGAGSVGACSWLEPPLALADLLNGCSLAGNAVTDDSAQRSNSSLRLGPRQRGAGLYDCRCVRIVALLYDIFRSIHRLCRSPDRNAKHIAQGITSFLSLSVNITPGNNAIVENSMTMRQFWRCQKNLSNEDYPFIKVNLEGFTRYSKFKLLWRQESDISVTHALPAARNRDGTIQIAMAYGYENYRGRIADIALLFYDGPAMWVQKTAVKN